MNTIELILLDMDGTMFDTERIWFEVCRKLLEDIGHLNSITRLPAQAET